MHPGSGIHALRLEMTPLGCLRAYIRQTVTSASDPPPPWPRRLRMVLDVATGLGYLHSRGVTACDLSATNLFVFGDLSVKLGDFGGALLEGAGFDWDQAHEARYHLPARGRAYDDVPLMRRQLFSLGSAIYEITAWQRPFPDLSDEEVDARYARDEFPSLGGNVAGRIIGDCWGEVYATVQDVIADLKALMANSLRGASKLGTGITAARSI